MASRQALAPKDRPLTSPKRSCSPEVVLSESHEQRLVIFWADSSQASIPELRWLYAVPNGLRTSIGAAVKAKKEGLREGCPDLVLPVARKGFHGLYIEMKRKDLKPKRGGKGGLSAAQAEWLSGLAALGHLAIVCYGADEAIMAIREYLACR